MSGYGTNYFTSKRQILQDQHNALQSELSMAAEKLTVASNALALLEKPTLSQAEAETLVQYYQQTV